MNNNSYYEMFPYEQHMANATGLLTKAFNLSCVTADVDIHRADIQLCLEKAKEEITTAQSFFTPEYFQKMEEIRTMLFGK
jgi:hypothetical protein